MYLYSAVTAPRWGDAEHTRISCVVTFTGLGDLPFTARADDPAEHGRKIWSECVAGTWGVVAEHVAPTPTLEEVKTSKVAELRVAGAAAIVGGFESDALGAVHGYPSTTTDQINLMGSVVAAQTPEGQALGWVTPFWCADPIGVWAFRDHTAAQIVAVGLAGKAHVVACQTRLDTLCTDVAVATTAAAVNAIVWG